MDYISQDLISSRKTPEDDMKVFQTIKGQSNLEYIIVPEGIDEGIRYFNWLKERDMLNDPSRSGRTLPSEEIRLEKEQRKKNKKSLLGRLF